MAEKKQKKSLKDKLKSRPKPNFIRAGVLPSGRDLGRGGKIKK